MTDMRTYAARLCELAESMMELTEAVSGELPSAVRVQLLIHTLQVAEALGDVEALIDAEMEVHRGD